MTNLVTSFSAGADRNNFSGYVGMRFTAGASVPIASLGVRMATGDTGTRLVSLYSGATLISSATVTLGSVVGAFYYAPASGNLVSGTVYDLVVQQTSGGQLWSDYGAVATTSVANTTYAIFGSPGSFTLWQGGAAYVGVDIGYGSPGAPQIVQSGFVRGNTTPLTITLGAAPTAGNLLLLIIDGWAQALGVPAGFTNLESDNAASHANEGTWTYRQTAPSGAATTYNFTGATDWHNIALFEISGQSGAITTANGPCTNIGSSPISSGSLVAAAAPALRFLTFQWDQNVPTPTTPSGWTLVSPGTFINAAGGSFHGSATWLIPAGSSGPQAVAFSPTDTYSVIWLDVAIAGVSLPPISPPPKMQRLLPVLLGEVDPDLDTQSLLTLNRRFAAMTNPPPPPPGIQQPTPNWPRELWAAWNEVDPDLDAQHPLTLFRRRTASTIQPQAAVRASQALLEVVATNPSPPMQASQLLAEIVFQAPPQQVGAPPRAWRLRQAWPEFDDEPGPRQRLMAPGIAAAPITTPPPTPTFFNYAVSVIT